MITSFTRRHVLEDHIAGFGVAANPHHLSVLRRPVIFSVLAHAGHESHVAGALAEMEEVSVRRCGPAEWLLVSEAIAPESLVRDLAAIGAGRASFLEQSNGRVVMSLSGPKVRAILAKCTAVDVHPDVFALGSSTNTLFCHVPVNLSRVDHDRFEIIVMRSYAGFVFDEVMEMGREYALTAGFA
ncbi:sarcosine oxidase subunit gamma family protein [Rhizobium sp. RU36D]|uniref:sarcosine oxidase subunit gamma n=1 Tax=Rhizobium sp. RU36D TaxID=1907415 RepID=UPI0009D7FE53|nr:sarcosine oxidase subunit gamma family protein [Rhizobium sp. RU36D]SMC40030.1 sarcosine oxidase subunit gamma [Rhizobium sp. RU36D]